MTAINALVTDGSASNRAFLTPPQSNRTNVGTPWARFGAVYLDSLAPGEDGVFWESRRFSNNSVNYGVGFDDGANTVEGLYNSTPGGASSAISAAAWYLVAETHSGTGNDVNVEVITLPGGAVVSSFTHTGSSVFSDGQTQELCFGARYNGTATSAEHRGRLCLMGGMWGTGAAWTQAQWQAFAADPLAGIDAILAEFGSSAYAIDDSEVDISANALTLTLAGTMAWGSGNGPDIPDRAAPVVDGPGIEYVSNGSGNTALIFDTLFVNELFAEISGSSFGVSQGNGGVFFNSSDTLNGNEVEYTGALQWSDTLIRMTGNVSIGTIPAGAVYIIVQRDDGLTGALQIEVKSVAADQVGVRGIPLPQTITLGQPFSLDASQILFREDCQQVLTFTATSLPLGLTCSESGVISGTVSHSAESSYSSEITGTDPLGAQASDEVVWTVLTPDPGNPEEPGSGGVVAGVVGKIALKDVSRSIGLA